MNRCRESTAVCEAADWLQKQGGENLRKMMEVLQSIRRMAMRGRRRRVISLMMALLLVTGMLAGCGGSDAESSSGTLGTETGSGSAAVAGESGSEARGRFLESRVTLPVDADRIYCIGQLSDGRSAVLAGAKDDNRGYLLYTGDAGENFTVQEAQILLEDTWVTASAIAPDGSALLAGFFYDVDESGQFGVKKIAPNGSVTAQPMELPEYTGNEIGNYVRQMGFDTAGRLFVWDAAQEVLSVDLATGECQKAVPYLEEAISYFGIAGERLFLISTELGLSVWQTTGGTELSADEALASIVKNYTRPSDAEGAIPMAFCEGIEAGSIAYVNREGIYYHMDGGSVDEQLMDSGMTTLASMSYGLRGVVMPSEETFLVLVGGGEGGMLLRYVYDANVSAVPESELTIYALEESALLRQAATMYQTTHPGIYVNLEIGMTGEDGVTAEDAITALNTEILAGNMPDVLILDGLPAESYVEKGVLADISKVVNEIGQADGMFTNVKAAYEQNGAIYMLPARFYTTLVSGTDEAVAAAGTLSGYADYIVGQGEAKPNQNIMQRRPPSELMWALFFADSGNWQKPDGTVDEARISMWLEQAGRIYDVDAYGVDEQVGRIHAYEGRLFGTVTSGSSGLLSGDSNESLGTVVNMMDLAEMFGMYAQTGSTYGLFGSQEAKCFVPYLTVGMSSNPAAPEAAEEFLRLMLGSELGGIDGNGFPINRTGWELMSQQALEDYGSEGEISMGIGTVDGTSSIGYELNKLTLEIVDDFEAVLNSLDTPTMTDATIRDLAIAQGVRYVTGEASLEEARSELLQQLNLYLAE